MELWFLFSLIAAVFAGLHIFVQKVGAERGYNSNLVNSYSAALSSLIGFGVAGVFEDYGDFSLLMLGIAFASGLIYIIGTNLRMDALRHIDATIFLPLHKFISPLTALIIGIAFLQEAVTGYELLGILLGLVVPLMLINRSEKKRQNNLAKGLVLMVISAILAAIAAAINKEGTNLFSSVLLFAATANACSAAIGALIYRYRKKDANTKLAHHREPDVILLSIMSGILQVASFSTFILAFAHGGSLAVVYTIHSFYILLPIVLSIVYFNEHWNARKIIAIALSIGALILMK